MKSLAATIVIYESPYRVLRTLKDIEKYWGPRVVAVCRELTKVFEETFYGNLSDAIIHFSKSRLKGEFIIMIAKEDYRLENQ